MRHHRFIAVCRAALCLAAATGLAACVDPASLALGGASVVSFTQTGKTLTDHAMSVATEQDCSLRNSLAGKPWCIPLSSSQPVPASDAVALYCYRSIAEVTCYRHANPHDTTSRRTLAPESTGGPPDTVEPPEVAASR